MKKLLIGFLLILSGAPLYFAGSHFFRVYTANVYKMGQQDTAKKFGERIGQCAASGHPLVLPMPDRQVIVLSCEVWQTEPDEPTDNRIKIKGAVYEYHPQGGGDLFARHLHETEQRHIF